LVEKIEVILEGVDRTQQAFATFRKNIESSISELRKARGDILAYSESVKNTIQWHQMSAKEYVKVTSQLRQFDKYVRRLTTQIPENQQEQARWVKAVKEGLNPIQQQIANFKEIAPLLDKVANKALDYNNTLIKTTGFTKKGSRYVETFTGRLRRLNRSFTEGTGALYKWGRVFNHYLPLIFVWIYAFRYLMQQLEKVTKVFADFESQLIVIERTTGMAHDTIARLGKIFLTLGEQLPTPLKGLEDIAITAGRLGIRGEANILAFTDAIVKMSNATVLSADSASNALARIANAMGIPIPYIENLGSSIDILANTSAANAEQISTVMRKAAGSAKTMELPASALAAMGATLVESGEEAARAGTRISRALVYASTKTGVMARQMGLSVKELRKRMEEDMLGVLLDYLKMLRDTPSKVERLAMAHEVFGMIGTKAIVKLANNYDTLEKHIKDAQDDMVYNITLEREYAKTLDTTAAKMQMLDNAIERQKTILGEKLAPAYFKMKEIVLSFYKILAGPEPVEYGNIIVSLSENLKNLLNPSESLLAISKEQTSIYETRLEDMPRLIAYEDAYAKVVGAVSQYEFKAVAGAREWYMNAVKGRKAIDGSTKSLKQHTKALYEDATYGILLGMQYGILKPQYQDLIHLVSRHETGIRKLDDAKNHLLNTTLGLLGIQETWSDARMQEIKDIEREVKAHHGSTVEFLARTQAVDKGAFAQVVFNDAMNRGMRVLAKYSPHMKRAVALAGSLTKTLIEEGVASTELKNVWEKLGELLEERLELATELSQVELQWNATTEHKADLEAEITKIWEDQLEVISKLLEGSDDLAQSYFTINDALQYLNGQYPTFESLTRGILASVEGAIVPIKALDLGIIKLGDILPSKYFKPLDILLQKHAKVVESFDELNVAELEYGAGSEEVAKARAKAQEAVSDYSKTLTDFAPVLTELNKKEKLWGLTESKRYMQIKDMAVLTKDELEKYKASIDASSQYYSNLDRIREIRDEIASLTQLHIRAEKLWQDASKDSTSELETYNKVLNILGITEKKERETALKRMKEIMASSRPLEERNRILVDYIAGLLTVVEKKERLVSVDAEINRLRAESNRLLYENLQTLANTGYISGKTADDLKLLVDAAQDVSQISKEDKVALKDMILSFIYAGESTGTLDKQMQTLGETLKGFGFSFEYIPDKAETAFDETRLIIKDAMGGIVIDSTKEFQDIKAMINELPEDTKQNLAKGVERWGTLFEKAKVLNIAFSAPMEDVFRNQLVELTEIKGNIETIVQKGIKVTKVKSMHTGGRVEYTGLHLLHKGEIVIPEKIVRQLNVLKSAVRNNIKTPIINSHETFIDGVQRNFVEKVNTNIMERTFSTVSSYLRSNEIYETNREIPKETTHVLNDKVVRAPKDKVSKIKDTLIKTKELIKYNNIINNIIRDNLVPQTGVFNIKKDEIVIPEPQVNNLIRTTLDLEAFNSLLASLKRLQGFSSTTNSTLREILHKGVLGSLQTGGAIGETGLYLLHEGEYVVPKSAPSQVMNIHIEHISLSPEYTAEKFLKDLESYRFSPL